MMKVSQRFRQMMIGMLLLSWILILAEPALAHSGHGNVRLPEITQESVGPFKLSVWSAPGTLFPGPVHLVNEVTDPNDQPAQECEVYYQVATDTGNLVATTAPAINFDSENPNEYEAEVILDTPGLYQVTAIVTNQGEVVGEVGFDLEVIPEIIWQKYFIFGSLLLIILFAVWWIMESFHVWERQRQVRWDAF